MPEKSLPRNTGLASRHIRGDGPQVTGNRLDELTKVLFDMPVRDDDERCSHGPLFSAQEFGSQYSEHYSAPGGL